MQRCRNSWYVRNILVLVLRLNKLAESIMSLHMRPLMRSTNISHFLECILHSSHVVDNAREDHISVTLNLHAESSPPQIAGDLNI
jgi:hypothetical protein